MDAGLEWYVRSQLESPLLLRIEVTIIKGKTTLPSYRTNKESNCTLLFTLAQLQPNSLFLLLPLRNHQPAIQRVIHPLNRRLLLHLVVSRLGPLDQRSLRVTQSGEGDREEEVLEDGDPNHAQRQLHHQRHLAVVHQLALRTRRQRKGHRPAIHEEEHRHLRESGSLRLRDCG